METKIVLLHNHLQSYPKKDLAIIVWYKARYWLKKTTKHNVGVNKYRFITLFGVSAPRPHYCLCLRTSWNNTIWRIHVEEHILSCHSFGSCLTHLRVACISYIKKSVREMRQHALAPLTASCIIVSIIIVPFTNCILEFIEVRQCYELLQYNITSFLSMKTWWELWKIVFQTKENFFEKHYSVLNQVETV